MVNSIKLNFAHTKIISLLNAEAAEDIKEAGAKLQKQKSKDRSKYEKQCYAKDADEEDNIIFEDFAKLRMSMSELDN